MEKFAVSLLKDNKRIILETFTSKEQAFDAGIRYRQKYTREQGAISCILADFDENDNMIGKNYKLYHTWG